MKMFKSVFEFPNYGMPELYKKREEAKELLKKRKGKTGERRKELRRKKTLEKQERLLAIRRATEASVISISNQAVPDVQREKQIHPRHKRDSKA